MHEQAKNFTLFVKSVLTNYFINKVVLDVGAGDINGTNTELFENCEYYSNDVVPAKNVTIVSKTKDLLFKPNSFDTIISSECFEHDPEYKLSILKIYELLKPGGLFLFTCASTGRAEHGTRRTSPGDSYGTIGNLPDMVDYYCNLTKDDINDIKPLDSVFSLWDSYYESNSCDLYFYGIKKHELPVYKDYFVKKENKAEMSIEEIFLKYDTDKNKDYHNYSRQYEEIFKNYRDRQINFLEIGVYRGESLRAFREVFKNAKNIIGIDINVECKKFESIGTKIEIGNFNNPEFVESLEKFGKFDVILDDGSHTNEDVIKAFEIFFPLLNDNGIYIVEDTICYKESSFINNNYPNHLEYFSNYTKFLNQWRYDSEQGIQDHCVDPFKIMKKTNNQFEYSIDSIHYGCSFIAISKKIRTHWIP
jgi:SAM-dependent methyltransferase